MDENKLKVVVDLYRLKEPNCGLGQFCLHLGRALAEQSDHSLVPIFHLRDKDRQRLGVRRSQCIAAHFWRKEELFHKIRRPIAPLLHQSRCDLWHSTEQFCRHWPIDTNTRVVLTIHDLNFLREKDEAHVLKYLGRIQDKVDRASCVTTISHFVADEIRQHLRLDDKPLHVIYNGACCDSSQLDVRPTSIPDGPFLFTIGVVDPKKNFHTLLPLLERMPNHRLVIAGRAESDYAQAIAESIRERGLGDRVFMLGTISDEHRQWLYANCSAFLFPSLTEGFGLPVIEAMQYGKPVFALARTSIPEICEENAFYWHSDDPSHMLRVFHQGMELAASDTGMAERLRSHAAQFNWTVASKQYWNVYKQTLSISHERESNRALAHAA